MSQNFIYYYKQAVVHEVFIVNGNQVEFLMELRGRILKLYGFAVINASRSV